MSTASHSLASVAASTFQPFADLPSLFGPDQKPEARARYNGAFAARGTRVGLSNGFKKTDQYTHFLGDSVNLDALLASEEKDSLYSFEALSDLVKCEKGIRHQWPIILKQMSKPTPARILAQVGTLVQRILRSEMLFYIWQFRKLELEVQTQQLGRAFRMKVRSLKEGSPEYVALVDQYVKTAGQMNALRVALQSPADPEVEVKITDTQLELASNLLADAVTSVARLKNAVRPPRRFVRPAAKAMAAKTK